MHNRATEPSDDSDFAFGALEVDGAGLVSLLETVLVHNADGILILDRDGVIITANPAASELFGRSIRELVGTPLGQPPVSGVRTELELLAPGEIRYAEMLAAETTWRGSPASIVTLRDITERRRAVEALRDYVSMTAHELATPMTSISGFAETLVTSWDEVPDEQLRQFAAIIHRQAGRVSAISQDLLALSRLDAAVVDSNAEVIYVTEAVQRVLDAQNDAGAAIAVDVPADLVVLADSHHVGTVLGNFVSNSLKYGQPPHRIEARVDPSSGESMVSIDVIDSGEGVPMDFVPHLFERFARARRGVATKKEGTGLGLAISRGFAQLNGGSVSYRANDPSGSIFTLTLPRP